MRKKRQRNKQTDAIFPSQVNELESLIKSKFENNSDEDLIFSIYEHQGKKIAVVCLTSLIATNKLESSLLDPLLSGTNPWTSQGLLDDIPLGGGCTTNSLQDISNKIIFGEAFIYVEEEAEIVSYPLTKKEKRDVNKAETETVVIGPQLAFTESSNTNLNVLRQILPSPDLVLEKIIVGGKIPREVRIIYRSEERRVGK